MYSNPISRIQGPNFEGSPSTDPDKINNPILSGDIKTLYALLADNNHEGSSHPSLLENALLNLGSPSGQMALTWFKGLIVGDPTNPSDNFTTLLTNELGIHHSEPLQSNLEKLQTDLNTLILLHPPLPKEGDKPAATQMTILQLCQEAWSGGGTPRQQAAWDNATANAVNPGSPLAQAIIDTCNFQSGVSSYTPPTTDPEYAIICQALNYLKTDLANKDIPKILQDITSIDQALSAVTVKDDPAIGLLSDIFQTGWFNWGSTIPHTETELASLASFANYPTTSSDYSTVLGYFTTRFKDDSQLAGAGDQGASGSWLTLLTNLSPRLNNLMNWNV